jgi:hypothetical protein
MSSNYVMTRRFLSLPVLLILTAVFGYSQIGIGIPGIGFPGRRYPSQGGPYPGSQNQPTTSFVGMLRSLSNDSSSSASSNSPYTTLVLETDDRRIVTVSLQKRTKYIGTSGGSAKITDFQPGDHIEIDATQDNNSDAYRAVKVTQLRQGTAEDRAEASQPIDGSGSGSGGSSAGDNDPDRPRLHRAASSDGDNTSSTASSSSSGSSSSSSGDDPDRPRMRRAAASDGDSTPQAQITPGDAPSRSSATPSPDPDDPGPPTLARGRPAPRSASSSSGDSAPLIAGSRPSIQAQDVNGVTRPPSAPVVDDRPIEDRAIGEPRLAPTGDPIIDMAREEAFSFSETLPNYVVKQFTTRYITEVARNRGTSWRALDTITADLVYQDGKESYKNFLVNGRVSREAPEKSGSWSSGEFASTLQDIMSPITNADFHGKRSTTIVNRPAYRYDFSVEQQNSHWHVAAQSQSYQPQYTGSVWIDKENYRVLRIELSARDMPRSFPLDQVESSVDYDYVLIGDQKYLLPTHSEALSCVRGTSDCSRNTIEFRNYKKFGAETNITFDTPDAPEKPDR